MNPQKGVTEPPLSELCQSCGLCCDGSLFTFLPMSEEEAVRMGGLGARVALRSDGRWALHLGCSSLRSSKCGAYDSRPLRCREFVCQLGRALERGERSLDAATIIVEEAKRRLRERPQTAETEAFLEQYFLRKA